ncbi:hypothetical protein BRADI_1g42254v3 [Brachypodium distachyon]|uniref:Uncharacterized protein n=1 Tax=Brachypodium distachyon TaxID=15368 RepID=A0A2K2DNU1_BRADI|nr:hypothetical protein BRADI_1g42254v3 [Brachypodium distachyon]
MARKRKRGPAVWPRLGHRGDGRGFNSLPDGCPISSHPLSFLSSFSVPTPPLPLFCSSPKPLPASPPRAPTRAPPPPSNSCLSFPPTRVPLPRAPAAAAAEDNGGSAWRPFTGAPDLARGRIWRPRPGPDLPRPAVPDPCLLRSTWPRPRPPVVAGSAAPTPLLPPDPGLPLLSFSPSLIFSLLQCRSSWRNNCSTAMERHRGEEPVPASSGDPPSGDEEAAAPEPACPRNRFHLPRFVRGWLG